MSVQLVISCEHAGNEVPEPYMSLFEGNNEVLATHRGWDSGAYDVANHMVCRFNAPFFFLKVSRLLIEVNRSTNSESLFSEYSKVLPEDQKKVLLQSYYLNYRNEVENEIVKKLDKDHTVVHLSIHSFTPVMKDVVRKVDLGLLCDVKYAEEYAFCKQLKKVLEDELPKINTVINEPYNGADDGFTTYLRAKYVNKKYLGIEIEVNQKFVDGMLLENIKEGLTSSIDKVLTSM